MKRIGIFGYECTKDCSFTGFRIVPRFQDVKKVRELAREQGVHNLTAFLEVVLHLGKSGCP